MLVLKPMKCCLFLLLFSCDTLWCVFFALPVSLVSFTGFYTEDMPSVFGLHIVGKNSVSRMNENN